jgi:hypothetical protein
MSARAAAWLAWSLAGLSIAMYLAGAAFVFVTLTAGEKPPKVGELAIFTLFLAFPIVGALVASKRPGNAIGWLCLAVGLFWMLTVLDEQHRAYELAITGEVTSSVTLDALFEYSWVLPVGLLGIYMILLFPDGRLPSRRWRPFAWFAGVVMFVICVGFVFIPGPLQGRPGVRNPLGLEGLAWLADVAVFIVLMLPACIVVSAVSLVLRYRRARGEVRQQIKWLAFAACFVGVGYLVVMIVLMFFAPEALENQASPTPLWVDFLTSLLLASFAGIPVAVGIAILRYRLYDIDIIINRALVYVSLTATLVVVYLGGVVLLQRLFLLLTGQRSTLAIVASTLLIAALFSPLRRWVQGFVDRRFYRKKYDAAKTLDAFSVRLRDETRLDALGEDLIGVVTRTVQPAHASLWLRPEAGPKGEQAD